MTENDPAAAAREPDTELALVLLDGPDEAVAFPGIPGTWLPGRPIAIRALELTEEQARELAAGPLGIDLIEVDRGSAPAVRENRLESESLRRRGAAVVVAQPDEPSPEAAVDAASPAAVPGDAPARRRRPAAPGDQEQPAEPPAGDGPETGEA